MLARQILSSERESNSNKLEHERVVESCPGETVERKDWFVHVCFLLWKDQWGLNYSFSPWKAEWKGRRWLRNVKTVAFDTWKTHPKVKKYVLPDIPQPFPFFSPLVWGFTRDVADATYLVVFIFFLIVQGVYWPTKFISVATVTTTKLGK